MIDNKKINLQRQACAKMHLKNVPKNILARIHEDDRINLDNYEAVVFEYMPHNKRALIEIGLRQGLVKKDRIEGTNRFLIKPRKIPYVGKITGGEMVDLHQFLMGEMLQDAD